MNCAGWHWYFYSASSLRRFGKLSGSGCGSGRRISGNDNYMTRLFFSTSFILCTFAAMFEKLQRKWGVNGLQLALILVTFALGGSLCGYAGKKLLGLLAIESRALWLIAYIILITLLWPLCVLLISIPLGQYHFFIRYIKKIGRRFAGKKGGHS
jgi:hypothetical protein